MRSTERGVGRVRRGTWIVALGLLGACESAPRGPETTEPEVAELSGAEVRMLVSEAIDEIAQIEDARTDPAGALVEHLRQGAALVRARAAMALGRMPVRVPGELATAALCEALSDGDVDVRHAAAFALGMRGDDEAAGVLLGYTSSGDEVLRARVVEALSKLTPADDVRAAVVLAMEDPSPAVVVEAVVGTTRWSVDDPAAGEVDTALLAVLKPFRAPFHEVADPHPDVVWYTLFALSRRGSDKGRGAYEELARSASPLARLYAVRGLARLVPDEPARGVLTSALGDADWRVVSEAALALGDPQYPGVVGLLIDALAHRSFHVRASVCAALGEKGEETARVTEVLERVAEEDPSRTVRGAALEALVAILPSELGAERIAAAIDSDDFVVRAAAARAAGTLDASRAIPLLSRFARDTDLTVRGEALTALGSHRTLAAQALLVEHATGDDMGLRMAAIQALAPMATADHVDALAQSITTAAGDGAAEVKFLAARALADLGGDRARAVIAVLLGDESPYVREVARAELAEHFPEYELPELVIAPTPRDEVPLAGRHFPRYSSNPLVEVETTRGTMVFELFPAEAPIHVHNFLTLARDDHYDGLRFHRVVTDFVVQGGDYRGDGNGAAPWRDGALRHEISPRKYTRGSLGMPRNEDWESGGSQIFVTHRPTPHLDGRYTIFGELRAGGDVLDALEVGDLLVDVRPLP